MSTHGIPRIMPQSPTRASIATTVAACFAATGVITIGGVDWRQPGWPGSSIGAVIAASTLLFGIAGGISPALQILRMTVNRSARDVSPVFLAVLGAASLAGLAYGIVRHDPVIATPNALGAATTIAASVVAARLRRTRPPRGLATSVATLTIIGATAIAAMSLHPQSGDRIAIALSSTLMLVLGTIAVLAPGLQLRELTRHRSADDVSPAFLSVLAISYASWLAYGIVRADHVLTALATVATSANFAILVIVIQLRRGRDATRTATRS